MQANHTELAILLYSEHRVLSLEKHIHTVAVPANTTNRLQSLDVSAGRYSSKRLPQTRASSMDGILRRLFRQWVHGWHATPSSETNQHALDDWVLGLHESSHWYHRRDSSNVFNKHFRCTPSTVPSFPSEQNGRLPPQLGPLECERCFLMGIPIRPLRNTASFCTKEILAMHCA